MKAAVIQEIGGIPAVLDVPEPQAAEGDVIVEMVAATLNPADLAIGAGRFHAGHPPLPYTPGLEAVGRVGARTVLAMGNGLGVSRSGTLSDHFVAPLEALIDLPKGTDPATGVALGTAGLAGWLPITWRAAVQPGETVLILGATGTAGMVAAQAARAAGAVRVIAAGRNREKLDRIASLVDESVLLTGDDLTERLRAACGDGVDVIYDPLWGLPLAAALAVCAPGGRVVHVGAAAEPVAEIASAVIRGRQVSILGYSNLAVPRGVVLDAYFEMVRRAGAGELVIHTTTLPLEEAPAAWTGTRASVSKYVLLGAGA